MIRCVAFDFGQVLSSPSDLFTGAATLLGVSPSDYEALYWKDRVAYDCGGTDSAYWTPILTALGKPATPEMVRRLAAFDAQTWVDGVRDEALDLMRDVREAGRLVAVVSNAPFALDMAFAQAPYADLADYWFVSASMNVVKPNPATYFRVEEVTELAADEIAFIDDRPRNVDGARAQGWQAHLWVDDADTRAWLTSLGVLS